MCVCVQEHECDPECHGVCAEASDNLHKPGLPFHQVVFEIKLSLSHLVAITFTHWAISLAPNFLNYSIVNIHHRLLAHVRKPSHLELSSS